MYIKSLSYTDKSKGWSLEHIDFNRLSLLVGLSGAGKTRILDALNSLQNNVMIEHFVYETSWSLVFEDNAGREIQWEGEIDEKSYIPMGKNGLPFVMEKIYVNNDLIAQRLENGDIELRGNKTVKLPRENSILFLLKEESDIQPIFESLNYMWFLNDFLLAKSFEKQDFSMSIQELKQAFLHSFNKLFIASYIEKTLFTDIILDFLEIFPFVNEIKFNTYDGKNYFLELQEKNSENWIELNSWSSGMYRTLYLLASIYLSPPKSVFLIDELENSFGLNCLSEVIDKIMATQDMQFILTSHHPYIINNISSENWILVERDGSEIKTQEVAPKLSKISTQDKFIQLTNLLQDDNDED